MKVLEEKRKIIQIEEKGIWETKCAIIPTFRIRKTFITEDEHRLYRCLEDIYKNTNIKVSAQVSLNRIIEANSERYYKEKPEDCITNKIKGFSIDFVLFDINTNEVYCCIELNGKEHDIEPKKRERDAFLRETFDFFDVPLIMIKSHQDDIDKTYDQTDIKNIIDIEIQKKKINKKKMTELETTKPTD